MTKASHHKWHDYEQSLLAAMGHDDFPPIAPVARFCCYQLLLLPSFHAPCCLRVVLTEQEGELSFSLMLNHSFDLFQAVWREDTQATEQTICLARRSCLEDVTVLKAEQVTIFQQSLSELEPVTLEAVDLAARDGISIRCDCLEQNKQHQFTMTSPTFREAPRHTGLVLLFLDLAQAHFAHPQFQTYLVEVHKYFD